MFSKVAVSTLVALVATVAGATEYEVMVNPASSSVSFELKATLHTVHGTASLSSGRFRFDPAAGRASGEIVVDATSADTGNGSRDKKMHLKVLRTAEHPRIVLRPERIEGDLKVQGRSSVELVGTMELSGSSHPVRIPLDVRIEHDRVVADADFEVPYVEWGLKDPSSFALRVAKVVFVSVHLEGTATVPQSVE